MSTLTEPLEVDTRLVYWTAPHPAWRPNPEWPEDVGCVLYRGEHELVLIDPLIRDDLDGGAWEWLDETVAGRDAPVVVLLTAPWHERSTRSVVERYNARVWASARARSRIADLPQLAAVPDGVSVFTPSGVDEGQVAFLIDDESTLVVAELFVGTAHGLTFVPSPVTHDLPAVVESVRTLEHLPVERVLVAHGPPVLRDGRAAIAAALRAFAEATSTG